MTDQPAPTKPLPIPDDDSRAFFEGGMAGRLMLLRCRACGTHRLPGRRHCDECLGDESDEVTASGRGVIRSLGVMHQRYHPGFFAELPYNLGWVELDEGPRLVTNFLAPNSGLRIGMPVEVVWERYEDGAVPKFRPV